MAGLMSNEETSPIKSAFDLWRAAYETANSMPGDQDVGWCLVFRLSEEIAAMPSNDAKDVLYKMMAYTMLGDDNFSLADGPSGSIIRDEALSFLGVAA